MALITNPGFYNQYIFSLFLSDRLSNIAGTFGAGRTARWITRSYLSQRYSARREREDLGGLPTEQQSLRVFPLKVTRLSMLYNHRPL